MFVVSLDFELHWGIRDHTSARAARERLLGAREAIPHLLDVFRRRGVRATWATVGMLMARDRGQLLSMLPSRRPRYQNTSLSPYLSLAEVGNSEGDDPLHYAPSLVRLIAETPGQEIGTHTFSHYYCQEAGQGAEDFAADLVAARAAAESLGVPPPRSIVFPRNQVNESYLDVLGAAGIEAYRTNSPGWCYAPSAGASLLARAARLVDAYVGLTDPVVSVGPSRAGPVPVPASIFLRPYAPRARHLDSLRLRRITRAIHAAAQSGRLLHLWWHPHNFGLYLRENMRILNSILDEVDLARRRWSFTCATMLEARREAT